MAVEPKKREHRTTAVVETPAKGYVTQHMADAPMRERGPSVAVTFKGLLAQVGGIPVQQQLDARASIRDVRRAYPAVMNSIPFI